jgi:hypothetical protein
MRWGHQYREAHGRAPEQLRVDSLGNCAARDGIAVGEHRLWLQRVIGPAPKNSAVPVNCCASSHYWFRPYGESLSLCLRERESNQRESAPDIRVWLRQTSLAPALLRGSSRWAIPGPSFLVWHPCQTPLYTAPPLGLLTGQGIAAPANIVGAVLTAKLLIRQPTHQRWRQA